MGIFKPKEIIIGEPFDLHLTFKNNGQEDFSGGECRFHTEEGHGYSLFNYHEKVESIKPEEAKTVVFKSLFIKQPGYAAMLGLTVNDLNGNEVFRQGEKDIYPIKNATREELYQKYSVIVALFFSTLASILTVINVLVSIFGAR